MSTTEVPTSVRLPEALRLRLTTAAQAEHRSLSREIVLRLERSFGALVEPGAAVAQVEGAPVSKPEGAGSSPARSPGSTSDSEAGRGGVVTAEDPGGEPAAAGAASGGEGGVPPESPSGCWDHRGKPKSWCQACQAAA